MSRYPEKWMWPGYKKSKGNSLIWSLLRKKNTVVDISDVSFIGSMGLRVFLSAAKSLSWEKKSLILVQPQPMVSEVLEASSFQDIVTIEQSMEAAVDKAKA